MHENIDFIGGVVTALTAIGAILGTLWRMLMRRVKETAQKEVTDALDRRLSDVASKSAVEDVKRQTQHITERLDELFTVLISDRSHRTDSR